MTHLVKVLNKNHSDIVDFFDGIAYKFVSGEGVNVPLHAARHIFGVDFPADEAACKSKELRDQIFHTLQKRWGWNSALHEKVAQGRKMFDKIEFIPVLLQTVELVAKAADIAEPREAKPAPKSLGKFKPRADEAEEASEEEVA